MVTGEVVVVVDIAVVELVWRKMYIFESSDAANMSPPLSRVSRQIALPASGREGKGSKELPSLVFFSKFSL